MSDGETEQIAQLEGDQLHVFDGFLQQERSALNLP